MRGAGQETRQPGNKLDKLLRVIYKFACVVGKCMFVGMCLRVRKQTFTSRDAEKNTKKKNLCKRSNEKKPSGHIYQRE